MRTDEGNGELPWIALESTDVDRDALADALAFCDSTGDHLFRPDTDIELSHWFPNKTPAAFRADTSTGMVLRFVADHPDHRYVGVGAHCDTDAAMSLFALVRPELAVEHAALVVATAETGDFGFWPDEATVRLYSEVRAAWEPRPGDHIRDRIKRSFATINEVLTGERQGPSGPVSGRQGSAAAVDVQARSDALIGRGVERQQVSERFVAYVVDPAFAPEHIAALGTEPRFDRPIGEHVWASHRTRNRQDGERVQLLSIPSGGGWVHSIWHPQYLPWDTSTLWRPDGLEHTGAQLEWRWSLPHLDDGLAKLQAAESSRATWGRAELLAPWAPGFPILASCGLVDGASKAGPDEVVAALEGAWS